MKLTTIRSIAAIAGVFTLTTMSAAHAVVDNSQPPAAAFCSGACGVGSAIGFSRTVPQAVPNDSTSFSDIWEFTLTERGNINGIVFANNTLDTFRLIDTTLSLENGGGTPVEPAGGFMIPNPPPFNSVLETAIAFSDLSPGTYQFVISGFVPNDQVAGQYEFQGGVSAVPLPAAGWLLITAILGLLGLSRPGRRLAKSA